MAGEVAAGLYEDVITEARARRLAELESDGRIVERQTQNLDWHDRELSLGFAVVLEKALATRKKAPARAALLLRLYEVLHAEEPGLFDLPDDLPTSGQQSLTWVSPAAASLGKSKAPTRPKSGLVHPALLFNGSGDASIGSELIAEVDSADRIDAVVAFLKKSGLNLLRPALSKFFSRGGALRLLTTTYIGATERQAVEELVAMGGQVRVVYEEGRTRLHAKAWHFRRESQLCTAYVGSSNLSRVAMTDGAEWNVRLTRRRTPDVLERFHTAFEQLWDGATRDYDPASDGGRLQASLRRANPQGADSQSLSHLLMSLQFAPKTHQLEVLEALAAEREHGHRSNLVVSATGTGKTWMSAFDYARLRAEGEVDTLLFVAHRREILEQSRDVFRAVLKDPNFGELLFDGHRPVHGKHVFASVQSLRREALLKLDPDAVDMLIIDEFHHAAAPSYRTLLEHLTPVIRLGLTATPERMDGKSVLHWFDHRIAAEIRLWDALDAQLLCPFHYFGVHDPTSAERAWKRGKLQQGELDNLYTGDHARARRVLEALGRYVADPTTMRMLGFCVGVGHAQLMATTFQGAGLKAIALHAKSSREERSNAVTQLRSGTLQAIFTVDLFNEGVDVPEVDTVLFLRPTESATVFLQQLGRGLRTTPEKAQLTVLDFVGHVHQDYRYDTRYRALLGGTLKELQGHITSGFPRLPSGTAIQLEPKVREAVLASIKRFVGSGGYRLLIEELGRLPATTALADFLARTDHQLTDVFDPTKRHSWSDLRRRAGHDATPEREGETVLRGRVARLLHVDDAQRFGLWREWLTADTPPILANLRPEQAAVLRMLIASLGDKGALVSDFQDALDDLWKHATIRAELVELLALLEDRQRYTTRPLQTHAALPFSLHATYTRNEVIAGLNEVRNDKLITHREGPLWSKKHQTNLFFVTLEKSEDQFKPSVRYADYPISPTRFHWESQNSTHDQTKVGKRYVEHEARGVEVVFFVRARAKDSRGVALPFQCLGPATYIRHKGARPMQIEWELAHAMPPALLKVGLAVAG